jgi:hypothetical protein
MSTNLSSATIFHTSTECSVEAPIQPRSGSRTSPRTILKHSTSYFAGYIETALNQIQPYPISFESHLSGNQLQDHIMSNAFTNYRNKDLLPSIHMMDCAYAGTSPKSPLRKFIVRGFHWALCRKDSFNVVYDNVDHENGVWSIDNLQSLLVVHPDLQRDFLALLREDITPRHLEEFTACDFHCHSKDEHCHLC